MRLDAKWRVDVSLIRPHLPVCGLLVVLLAVGRHAEAHLGLSGEQHVQSLQIEGQAYQTPFSRYRCQAAQRELAEAQHLLDDADDGLHGRFAQSIDRLADLRLQFAQWVLTHTPF